MPEQTPDNNSPFSSSLELSENGRRETFHQLEQRPDLFVRRRAAVNTHTDAMAEARDAYAHMEGFGVKIPKYSAVVGEDSQGKAEFLVVDRVMGEPLEEILEKEKELPGDVVNRTFDGVVDYLRDGFENNRRVYSDFTEGQFMYGHTAKDPRDDLYMVDVDRTFRRLDGETLVRVIDMMSAVHETTPIDTKVWQKLKELTLEHDQSKGLPPDVYEHGKRWLDENLPPTGNQEKSTQSL